MKGGVCVVVFLLFLVVNPELLSVSAATQQKTPFVKSFSSLSTLPEKFQKLSLQRQKYEIESSARVLLIQQRQHNNNNNNNNNSNNNNNNTVIQQLVEILPHFIKEKQEVFHAMAVFILGLFVVLFFVTTVIGRSWAVSTVPEELKPLTKKQRTSSRWFRSFEGNDANHRPLYSLLMGKRGSTEGLEDEADENQSVFFLSWEVIHYSVLGLVLFLLSAAIVAGSLFFGSTNYREFIAMLPLNAEANSYTTAFSLLGLWMDYAFTIFGFVLVIMTTIYRQSLVLFTRDSKLWFRFLFGLMMGFGVGTGLGVVLALRSGMLSAGISLCGGFFGLVFAVFFSMSLRGEALLEASTRTVEDDEFLVTCDTGDLPVFITEASMFDLRRLYHMYEHKFIKFLKKNCHREDEDCFDPEGCLDSLEDFSRSIGSEFVEDSEVNRECFSRLSNLANLQELIPSDAEKINSRMTVLDMLDVIDSNYFQLIVITLLLINSLQGFTGLAAECHPLMELPPSEQGALSDLRVCQSCFKCDGTTVEGQCRYFRNYPNIPGLLAWKCSNGAADKDVGAGVGCELVCQDGLRAINEATACEDNAVFGAAWSHLNLYGASNDALVPSCVPMSCPVFETSFYPECCLFNGTDRTACSGCANICMSRDETEPAPITHKINTDTTIAISGTRIFPTVEFVIASACNDTVAVLDFLRSNQQPLRTNRFGSTSVSAQAEQIQIPKETNVTIGQQRLCGGYTQNQIRLGDFATWKTTTVQLFREDEIRKAELFVVDFGAVEVVA